MVIKSTWDEFATYRVNFAMWRLRTIVQFLASYFLWLALIPSDSSIGVYNQQFMMTYIVAGFFLLSIVLSSRSYVIGEEINNGNLSNFLIRPLNYFLYWFSKDIGDKAMNIVFSIFELVLLFFLLKPDFFMQTNLFYLLSFVFFILSAVGIYFFINVLCGSVGFWTQDTWAPRFLLYIVLGFLSGGMFPLDILPNNLYAVFSLSPFAYLLYFPIKIYLGQISIAETLFRLFISVGWNIVLFIVIQHVWSKGLRLYTAQGK